MPLGGGAETDPECGAEGDDLDKSDDAAVEDEAA
jgi:hypothetical protein